MPISLTALKLFSNSGPTSCHGYKGVYLYDKQRIVSSETFINNLLYISIKKKKCKKKKKIKYYKHEKIK